MAEKIQADINDQKSASALLPFCWGVVFVAAMMWILWPKNHADTVWHYRMTVSVETPEGLKSGSAVREVIYGGATKGGGGPGLALKCRGEAVMVDLGERGKFFALLGSGHCTDVLLRAFNGGVIDPASVPNTGKVTLTPDNYPIFVRFRDEKEPKTVESVTKIIKEGAFEKGYLFDSEKFGAGVQLKEITIEVTNDPITTGITQLLPWLPRYQHKMLDGESGNFRGSQYPFANSLSAGSFTTEINNGR